MPRLLPGNEDIWRAFNIVINCRQVGMAMGGFDWQGVRAKLELHGLWTERVERGLSVCETAMLNAEAKHRERNQDTKPPPRAPRRRR